MMSSCAFRGPRRRLPTGGRRHQVSDIISHLNRTIPFFPSEVRMAAWNHLRFWAIVLGLFLVSGACTANDLPATKVKVGDTMEDFTLPDTAGAKHSLYEFKGKEGVMVIFFATQCPYSNAFNHVMAGLAKEYGPRGVTVVGINANKTEPAAEVAEHARAHGLSFPILKDEGNVIANRLGARVTPEVYLLDSKWTLRYH